MKMYDEMTSTYMEPMAQQGLQGLNRPRTSWNQRVPSLTQPLTQVALVNSNSNLNLQTYSSQSAFRKNDIFDVSDSEKQDIKLAFTLFDSRKVGRLSYRELKVIKTMTILCSVICTNID